MLAWEGLLSPCKGAQLLVRGGVKPQKASKRPWKRNKKVARKRGFEGVRERLVPWHGWRVVHIGCTAWRPVPPLFSSCLALRGALLDRDAQQPLCYASRALIH